MSVTAIIAAQRKRKERELVEHLRGWRALSPTTATEIESLRGLRRAALRGLVRHQAVLQTAAGLYWLDEAAYVEMRAKRRRFVAWAMILVLVLAAIAIAAVFTFSGRP